jgi:BirA family transcriptional regulator, biotin operon repressor / biotin---[acetyl-CoA-carboxylase] ligase
VIELFFVTSLIAVAKNFIFILNSKSIYIFINYLIKGKIKHLLLNKLIQPKIGSSLEILPIVDSSNNYAMGQINDGKAEHGFAYMALQQTGGKGQREKAWHTGNNKNLALSIVLIPNHLKIQDQFLLNAFVATTLSSFLTQKNIPNTIKWPNDIYCADRKAAGILIENILQGKTWKYAVVGIGLNVNEEDYNIDITNAISLKQITNEEHDVYSIAKDLLDYMQFKWEVFILNSNSAIEDLNNNLYKRNEQVKFKQGTKTFSSVIKKVTTNGKLICGDNEEFEFNFGAVQWVI